MKKCVQKSSLHIICILMLTLPVMAQEADTSALSVQNSDVTELSTISVQGQQKSGPNISTSKLLKVAGSGGDPLKAIEALPGVVLDGNGEGGEPAVRGSSPEDNYYQTDHMPVGYLFHTLGDSTYNPDTIEEFSLKAGAWGSEYGDAIGAVLDTQLRDPYQDEITTIIDLSFLRAGILVEGALTENSAFYASWREGLLDWYVDHIDEPEEDIAITQVPKFNDYQVKYHYRLSPTSNLKLIALGARDSMTLELGEDFEEAAKEPGLVGRINFDSYYNTQGLIYDTLLQGGTTAMFIMSHMEQDFNFQVGSLFDILAKSNDIRLKSLFETPLDNGDMIKTGFEFIHEKAALKGGGLYTPCNEDLEVCDPGSLGVQTDVTDNLTLNRTRVFTAYDWMATPFLEVTLGLNGIKDHYLNDTGIEPRITARYELNPTWMLTAAVGQHSQTPRDFFAILENIGNPNLNMPTSQHVVAGFEYTLNDSISAKLEAYYKTLDGLIISNPDYDATTAPNELTYINGAEGHAYGLEFLINKNLTDKWYGWMSVAYSKTKRNNTLTGEHFTYSYDRPWIVNVVASYEMSKKTTVGIKWRYQSGNLVTPITGGVAIYQCDSGFEESNAGAGCGAEPYLYDPIEGKINSERLPAGHGLDFRLDYKKSQMTDVYFEIINAYGQQNISEYEYSDDYRTREGVSELETLVSLGARFTF